eukprot:TRINITY_DN9006_c0_g1_i1.p2 TRINITY_DN9006_c0_g1~~TRINITY_DN9006_c0_g1_i1.p2  ORF type:complete len:200 (+),score=46.45 TRINITY_DN9006_c0_g1_i1:1290-1889(+)
MGLRCLLCLQIVHATAVCHWHVLHASVSFALPYPPNILMSCSEHMAKVEIRHHKRLLDLLLTRLHVMEEVQRQHYADLRSFDTSVFESDLTQRVTTATKELAAQLKTARKSHKPLKFDAGDGHKLSKAELNEQAKVFEARLEREADAKRRAFDTDLDVSRAQLQAVYAEIDGKMREFYQRQKDDFASFSPRSSLDASVT